MNDLSDAHNIRSGSGNLSNQSDELNQQYDKKI